MFRTCSEVFSILFASSTSDSISAPMLLKYETKAPLQQRRSFIILFFSLFDGYKILRSKFVAIHDQTALITVIAHLAGNHFDGHADFYV
jgi:hypothetical protein